mmetsp:Transcript_27377/g.66017  ORF Transcript_27377/g.66017 Transcript_27377/m.66017 type:complete len:223 (+) Transcript_27377:278-946(+)
MLRVTSCHPQLILNLLSARVQLTHDIRQVLHLPATVGVARNGLLPSSFQNARQSVPLHLQPLHVILAPDYDLLHALAPLHCLGQLALHILSMESCLCQLRSKLVSVSQGDLGDRSAGLGVSQLVPQALVLLLHRDQPLPAEALEAGPLCPHDRDLSLSCTTQSTLRPQLLPHLVDLRLQLPDVLVEALVTGCCQGVGVLLQCRHGHRPAHRRRWRLPVRDVR